MLHINDVMMTQYGDDVMMTQYGDDVIALVKMLTIKFISVSTNGASSLPITSSYSD